MCAVRQRSLYFINGIPCHTEWRLCCSSHQKKTGVWYLTLHIISSFANWRGATRRGGNCWEILMQLLSDNSNSHSDYTLTHCSRVLDAHNSNAHTSGTYRHCKLHTTRCFHLHTLCTIPCCSNLNSCTQLQATRSQHTGNCTFAHLYICTFAHQQICTPPVHHHICTHTCTPAQNYLIPGPAYPASAGDPLWPRIHSQINWETISSIVDGNHDSLDDDLIIRRWMALNLLRNDPQCWEWMLLLNIICS